MAKKHYLKLSKVLQKLLYDKRMNASKLAKEVDLPVPTVHRLVTGKSTRPYPSSLKPIADYFSLNVEQLLGEEPIIDWETEDSNILQTSPIKTIPVIEWEKANQLRDITTFETQKKIATIDNNNVKYFALLMNDSSMEPLFPKRSILIFDPIRKPMDRSYVLVKLDNKKNPIFRQLLIDVDYKYLKPLNPDLNTYQMRLLTENDEIIACLIESRINHESEYINNIQGTLL